jgi:hypothetical protein
LENLT